MEKTLALSALYRLARFKSLCPSPNFAARFRKSRETSIICGNVKMERSGVDVLCSWLYWCRLVRCISFSLWDCIWWGTPCKHKISFYTTFPVYAFKISIVPCFFYVNKKLNSYRPLKHDYWKQLLISISIHSLADNEVQSCNWKGEWGHGAWRKILGCFLSAYRRGKWHRNFFTGTVKSIEKWNLMCA